MMIHFHHYFSLYHHQQHYYYFSRSNYAAAASVYHVAAFDVVMISWITFDARAPDDNP